jgi:hypothetical protein
MLKITDVHEFLTQDLYYSLGGVPENKGNGHTWIFNDVEVAREQLIDYFIDSLDILFRENGYEED